MSPENKIQDMYDQTADVSECQKCEGSGEVAISAFTLMYLRPGPVPDDASGVTASHCFVCNGTGYVVGEE